MPWDKEKTASLLRDMREIVPGEIRLMEVCGTHTMSIAEAGIKSMLPKK